ncbi:hypothetical protein [Pseudonocardia sp. MH-G8]|uniref:hypothetical protein n=1 Tax=Pseudonocardia sp. MH-G8 TaxID=1854588 RepID=UPI000BA04EEE|nr:hypothetical protein [Pseudonocardia sp. MH-G8]OZM81193.1 hypothetical protein CFP66_17635 [Pseudonocardia sp. MH-G8]
MADKRDRAVVLASSALGAAIQRKNPDPAEIERLRDELQAAQLAAAVKKAVAKFGPLAPEQRDQIAALLRSEKELTP